MNRSKILAGIADCTNSAEVNLLNSLQSFLWLCKRTTGSVICETSYQLFCYLSFQRVSDIVSKKNLFETSDINRKSLPKQKARNDP